MSYELEDFCICVYWGVGKKNLSVVKMCGQDYFLFDDTDERMSDSVANRYAIGRWLMTQL